MSAQEMNMECQAVGCENKMRAGQSDLGISFHSFPRNERLKRRWEQAVGGDNWTAPPSSVLCSAHFTGGDFLKAGNDLKLNSIAVPTIFTNGTWEEHVKASKVLKRLAENSSHFMENFDPDWSNREKRKMYHKFCGGSPSQPIRRGSPSRRKPVPLYDDKGRLIATGEDLCDCMVEACPGCHFPCPQCQSEKCGHECRVNRKHTYECIEVHGTEKFLYPKPQ